jgi:uncharacterized protein YdaU (DUF1376 family)
VNYFELHIGDYAEATGHLTFVEDAAYNRLMRKYYATEKPLPADTKAVLRLVGARTKEEKDAVATVLEEFFQLREDGWHNTRCDEEIERYQAGEPEREARKVNEANRLKRHREEKSRMFEALRAAGVTPAWNIKSRDLRALYERTCNGPATDLQRVAGVAGAVSPATGHVTPATASHSHFPFPLPIPSPNPVSEGAPGATSPAVRVPRETSRADDLDQTTRWELVQEIQTLYPPGLYRANDWMLAERAIAGLLEAGETPAELLAAAKQYRAQQDAIGKTGSQYILSPSKFYNGTNAWRGPFPVPASAAPTARWMPPVDECEDFKPQETPNA